MDIHKFVLVPYDYYLNSKSVPNRTVEEKILFNPNLKNKSKLLAPIRSQVPKNISFEHKLDVTSILNELTTLGKNQIARAETIVHAIERNPRLSISQFKTIIIDGQETTVEAHSFLYDLQHHNKKIPNNYKPILDLLLLPDHLVPNKNARSTNWSDYTLRT